MASELNFKPGWLAADVKKAAARVSGWNKEPKASASTDSEKDQSNQKSERRKA